MTTPDLLDALRAALGAQFVVERPLGAGAMGTVVLARDLTLERPVAVKVVNPELAASRSFRDRFLQEARTVAKLRHHNLVTVHAAGEAGGLVFAIMEYVPGESLRDRLDREGRLPADEAARLLHELAVALAYAHAQGVVHRDIKPENVLLDRETGRALLADFGVAQALAAGDEGADERATGLHHAVGSPRYMSPEQAAGERRVDGRSDLYALGVVGYEMLAGAPPFAGPGVQALLAQHITASPPPLAERAPDAPPHLVAAIERALAKDPAHRFPDAGAMARALLAPTRPDGQRGGAWPRRWKRVAAALAVAAGVGTGLAVWSARDGGASNSTYLVAPFEVLDDDPELAWLRRGSVNMLALDLAQWEDLRVVDYQRTLDLLRDAGLDSAARLGLTDAQRLARLAGAGTIVMGQVNRTDDSLFVGAALYDAETGQPGRRADAAALADADPRVVFDALARELLQIAGAPPIRPDLAETTTQSLAAYRDYVSGVEALNSWALERADSLFGAAVRADSTFALAHYKQALARGWRRMPDTSDVRIAEAALRHAGRLSVRDRALVEGYATMTRGLVAQTNNDFAAATSNLDAAIERYGALVARDSIDAESWYALGDARFHRGGYDSTTSAQWTGALRAFDRTLALDSTFHLAYAHKLLIYQQASTAGSPFVVVGDSLLLFTSDSAARAFGAARIAQARAAARTAAIAEARGWATADPDASQAHLALAEAYAAAAQPARAVQTLRAAMARPEVAGPLMPFRLAAFEAATGTPRALETLREAMRTQADALDETDALLRAVALSSAANAATRFGALDDAERLLALRARYEAARPLLPAPTARVLPAWRATLRLATGVGGPSVRREVDRAIALLEALEGPFGAQLRAGSGSLATLAFLDTRDARYLDVLRRWTDAETPPELRALAALAGGDTTAADSIAAALPPLEPTTALGVAGAGLRPFVRAELFTALGDARRALAAYDAIDPSTFALAIGMADPRWALDARSHLVRGQLHEQLGDAQRAAAEYERFLALWKDADPAFEEQRRLARQGLARVRRGATRG